MALCTAEVILGWMEERICAIRASWEAAELLLVDDKPLGWKECSNPRLLRNFSSSSMIWFRGIF